MRLILASSSPRRIELLKQVRFNIDVVHAADIDESQKPKENPIHLAKRLALEKAETVAKLYPNDVVIAADTIVTISRKILGKPENANEAREFIKKLSGRRHRVHSGICVISTGKKSLKVDTTIIKFKRISESELNLLISSNEWEGKSGGYMIQGIASAFVESINGSVSNVIGLPLLHANNMLRAHGIMPSN